MARRCLFNRSVLSLELGDASWDLQNHMQIHGQAWRGNFNRSAHIQVDYAALGVPQDAVMGSQVVRGQGWVHGAPRCGNGSHRGHSHGMQGALRWGFAMGAHVDGSHRATDHGYESYKAWWWETQGMVGAATCGDGSRRTWRWEAPGSGNCDGRRRSW